jgi:hypothetical protein
MIFKIGDLVRFVDEPIEGHITSIPMIRALKSRC